MKRTRNRKRNRPGFRLAALGLLGAALVTAALWSVFHMTGTSNAAEDVKFVIGSTEAAPVTQYTMESRSVEVYLKDDGKVYDDPNEYKIEWRSSKTDIITTTDRPSSSGQKVATTVTAHAVGQANLEMIITKVSDGGQVGMYSCTITVKFGVNKAKPIVFDYVNGEAEKSLILNGSANPKSSTAYPAADWRVEEKLELIFSSPGTVWKSSNKDVVAFYDPSDGTLKGEINSTAADGSIQVRSVGAGKAQITAEYPDSSTAETLRAVLPVYVRPLVKIRPDAAEKWRDNVIESVGNVDFSMDTREHIYVRTEDTDSRSLSQKLAWAVLYDKTGNGEYKFLKDSFGKRGSSFTADEVNSFQLDIASPGAYQVKGRAGFYRVLLFVIDTYKVNLDVETSEIETVLSGLAVKPLDIKLAIYANLKDSDRSMVVGDVFDVAGFFNLAPEYVQNNFDMVGATGAVEADVTGVNITAIENGDASVTYSYKDGIAENLKKLMRPGETLNRPYMINIHVIEGFKLNFSEMRTYVGVSFDLISSFDPSVTVEGYEWESSDRALATVENKGNAATVTALASTAGKDPVKITVTCTLPGGVKRKASCIVYISDTISDIKLNHDELTLILPDHDSNILKADGITGNVPFAWISSDPEIVSVSPEPSRASATVTGKKAGTAVVTVLNEKNYVFATCKVTVVGEVTGIKFEQGEEMTVRMAQGVVQMKTVLTPTDVVGVTIKYGSSETSVATVDQDGLVKLVGPGTTVVTANPEGFPLLWATCRLTVEQSSEGFKFKTTSLTMESGKSQKLEYTLTPADAKTTITWKSLDTSVASVTNEGLVTATAGGQTYIVATTKEGFTDICKVTVTQNATGITLSTYDVNVAVGETFQVEAKTTPASSTEKTFTWASRDPDIATVDSSGKITGVAAGKTTINVKTKGGKVEFVYVTVRDDVTGMRLNYTDRTITKGKSFTLKPIFTPAKPSNDKVTYRSTNPGKATVSASGVVKGVNGGMTVIVVTSDDGGFTSFCVVTVEEVSTALKVSPASTKLGIGKKLTLKATVQSNFATNKDLKWSSSNPSVVSVNQKGQITGKKLGKCTIRVRTTDGSGASASCSVTVIRQVTSIRLNKTTIRMLEGRTTTIRAVIKPSNATTKGVTWKSDDENVASIDSKGTIMALSTGRCKITAATKDGTNKKATCWVYVSQAVPATGITVSQKDMVLVKGTSEQLSVTIQPSGSTDGLSYASDNKNIASVSSKGRVTGRKSGVASIIITTSSGEQTTVSVTVVGLNKTNLSKRQYETETLWVEQVNSNVAWQSQDTSIATVDQTGRVICRKPGTTYIVASVRGIKLYCKVTVTKL